MSHGSGTKIKLAAPRSKLYQGPFGRICPELDPWSPPNVSDVDLDDHFRDFANEHMVERPGETPEDLLPEALTLEGEFSSNIPAAYTYFGQFVDHDITFDPAPLGVRQTDPNALDNFRTPRLDLDNVYGRGPADQPYLYQKGENSAKMAIGQMEGGSFPDLPRYTMPGATKSTAIIGDMRNDENAIVTQLQLAFLLAHNTLVDISKDQNGLDFTKPADRAFAFSQARQTLTWLYQHIVWNDFVVRIANNDVHKTALTKTTTGDGRTRWDLGLADVYKWKHQPFMPVEFSGAAYRFGHSMVRNAYQTNIKKGFQEFVPIFDSTDRDADDPKDLRGFRPLTEDTVVQWDWFLQMTSSAGPFPQMARKIDTKLANSLSHLKEGPLGEAENILAFRNLRRGVDLGLPSGLDVARKFGVKQVDLKDHEPESLWYYVLREAETIPGANRGNMLGRVGSIIVCSVFAGLLKGDPCSYVNADPTWTPDTDPLLSGRDFNQDDASWTLASIIRLSGLPVDQNDINRDLP